MPGRPVDIQFPLGGVRRRLAFQSQEPYTTPDALNVWPRDPIDGRMRGGSRPGLRKVFDQQLGGKVHLLSQVRTIEGDEDNAITTFEELFIRPLRDPPYSKSTKPFPTAGYVDETDFMRSGGRHCRLPLADRRDDGLIPQAGENYNRRDTHGDLVLTDRVIKASTPYTIELGVAPSLRTQTGGGSVSYFEIFAVGSYVIHCLMDETNPEPWYNSTAVVLTLKLNSRNLDVVQYVNGAGGFKYRSGNVSQLSSYSERLKVEIDSTGDIIATADGLNTTRTSADTSGSAAGKRIGFGMYYDASVHGNELSLNALMQIDKFQIDYEGGNPRANRNVIVAVGGANASSTSDIDIWFEDTPGVLTAPGRKTDTYVGGSAITNANGNELIGDESLGRLYIGGEYDSSTGKEIWVFDATAEKFSDPGTGTLANIGEHEQSGSAAKETFTGTDNPNNILTLCVWRNRVVVVDRANQQNVQMSRAGVPTNWDFSSIPVGAALALNTTGIDTGQLAEPVNALISGSDDYLLIGCSNSIYRLIGDPTLSGQVDQVAKGIGIVAPQAWARGPDGVIVFLSNDGLYSLNPHPSASPVSISREHLPNELRDISTKQNRVLMEYDIRNRGVFIGVTPDEPSDGSYFWFDWETKSFWPMSFNAAHHPFSVCYRKADAASDQRLLFGCRDGYIRGFFDNASTDDGVDFDTRLLIGPINLGGGGYSDGMLDEVIGSLGDLSANVKCEVMVGDSPEEAYNARPVEPFTLKAGKNLTNRPQRRGGACFIRLEAKTGRWALESLTIVRQRLGKQLLN